MIFRVYKVELYKIITSYRFRIALLVIIILSTYNILMAYRKFPDYNYIYESNKKDYTARISEEKKLLDELNSGMVNYSCYSSSKEVELDKFRLKHDLEFYSNHKVITPKKDFSQGLDKSIFDYFVWLPILLFFCCDIVCGDKSKNIIQMQFATKTDKSIIYCSKYMAIVTSMIFIFMSNLLFSYIFSGCLMGFSNLSQSMRCIVDYNVAAIERSAKELILLEIIFGIITCLSAAVIFIFVSTVVREAVISYIISVLIVINANSFYFTVANGFGFSKYFVVSFYYAYLIYLDGIPIYNIKLGLIFMLVQTVLLYLLGLYIYKRIE